MEDDYELAHIPGVAKVPEQNYYGQRRSIDRDEADLARLGKKPVLKVSLWPLTLNLIFRLMAVICSADLGSCRYWASVVPFSSPGRAC